jgi:hypothetical protein
LGVIGKNLPDYMDKKWNQGSKDNIENGKSANHINAAGAAFFAFAA